MPRRRSPTRERLGPRATVAGFVEPEALARLYASVDVVTLASEVEIRSMVGVEAMASGAPVLVSRKSGVAELFGSTPAMRVVESGPAAWTSALRRILFEPQARQGMRKAALDCAARELASWRDVLTEDLYALWLQATRLRTASELIA